MARVEQVRLPYADAPDASARVMKCGLRILELNGLGDELRDVDACAADAEVEAAMQSEFTEASDASSSLDDLSDRNSPSSVMEIDSANWQGPDLRAGAPHARRPVHREVKGQRGEGKEHWRERAVDEDWRVEARAVEATPTSSIRAGSGRSPKNSRSPLFISAKRSFVLSVR